VGASVLFQLTELGCEDVVLFERNQVASGATGRALGGVRNLFSEPASIELMNDNIDFFRNFEDRTGESVEYNQAGYLFLFRDDATEQAWRDRLSLYEHHDMDVRLLSATEVQERWPGLATDAIQGALLGADCGFVDPHRVTQGLVKAGIDRGGTVETGVEVTGITTSADGVETVETDSGAYTVDHVVNAAGPWAPDVAELVDVSIPFEFVQSGYLVTDSIGPTNSPLIVDERLGSHVRATENGEFLVGIEGEELTDPTGTGRITQAELLRSLEVAERLFPAIERAEVKNEWTGVLSVTEDGHPIVGPTDVDRYHVACGFSGHGLMMAPFVGKAIAETILTGTTDVLPLEAFSLNRFARPPEDRRLPPEEKSTSTATD
jgi:sarcosine oxidase subunit beta